MGKIVIFEKYRDEFEKKVIATGITKGIFSSKEKVSVKGGKLSKTSFGKIMGTTVESKNIFAIDYYGLFKKSIGAIRHIFTEKRLLRGTQLKAVFMVVVHFAAIRMEEVAAIAPELLTEFPAFKEEVLKRRGFKKTEENKHAWIIKKGGNTECKKE